MQDLDPNRSTSLTATTFIAAIAAAFVVVALLVWKMSDPTSRTASAPAASQTTGLATPSKAPPAGAKADPATQGASR